MPATAGDVVKVQAPGSQFGNNNAAGTIAYLELTQIDVAGEIMPFLAGRSNSALGNNLVYGDSGYGTPQQLITDGCQEIKWNTIQFGSLDDSTWGSGEADVSEIVVTFKTNALGTYTFTYRVIPAV